MKILLGWRTKLSPQGRSTDITRVSATNFSLTAVISRIGSSIRSRVLSGVQITIVYIFELPQCFVPQTSNSKYLRAKSQCGGGHQKRYRKQKSKKRIWNQKHGLRFRKLSMVSVKGINQRQKFKSRFPLFMPREWDDSYTVHLSTNPLICDTGHSLLSSNGEGWILSF